jgi:hypothetical protein
MLWELRRDFLSQDLDLTVEFLTRVVPRRWHAAETGLRALRPTTSADFALLNPRSESRFLKEWKRVSVSGWNTQGP